MCRSARRRSISSSSSPRLRPARLSAAPSAFAAIVVYAQELVPGRVGMISGVFFGFAFGMAGLGAAVLGELADRIGIDAVYRLCAYLPVIGVLAAFLPDIEAPQVSSAAA